MIAAEDLPHRRGAIIRARSDANAKTRTAGKWGDTAHQDRRAEQSPMVLEPGRKVGNLNRGASIISQRRDQYRRVSHVFLLRRLEVCKLDVEQPSPGRVVRDLEQAAEDRITVEAGETAPDDSSPSIDQRRYRAVSDDSKVQVAHERAPLNVGHDGRAAMLLFEAIGFAVQVEQPT